MGGFYMAFNSIRIKYKTDKMSFNDLAYSGVIDIGYVGSGNCVLDFRRYSIT